MKIFQIIRVGEKSGMKGPKWNKERERTTKPLQNEKREGTTNNDKKDKK